MTARLSAASSSPISASREWARTNLFSTTGSSVLTAVVAAVSWGVLFGFGLPSQLAALATFDWPGLLGGGLIRFVFDSADWNVVETNRRLYFLGRFPQGDTWRVWVILYSVSGLAGVSTGLWTSIGRRLTLLFAATLIPIFLFIQGGEVALLTAGTIALFAGCYAGAKYLVATRPFASGARSFVIAAWLLSFLVTMFLLRGVDTLLWGGLLLTIVLTFVGIIAAFPIGVLLAVGRASTFPVIRVFCTAYIELIRGVPLITILFMALFFLPLMVEPERSVGPIPLTGFELDIVARAMIAITIFSSAYLAETVRGGLQAIPRGQVEAAQALGLSTPHILALIVLPQALRAVIPAIVGQFISLFKDTSLIFILGLTDLLGAARLVTAQQEFFGLQAESLLFAALLYWIIAFSMSRASQQLERNLGVGER